MRKLIMTAVLLFCALPAWGATTVTMETNLGKIVLELDEAKAPETVKNFLAYVDNGFYQGTVFHRVIDGFMIQGGGFDTALKKKPTAEPIKNEADNGLKNLRGTIAMARTSVVDSATSQFFINLVDNAFLDHRAKTAQGYGYAVFGKVIAGMEVVDRIGKAPTSAKSALFRDLPQEQVVITKVVRGGN